MQTKLVAGTRTITVELPDDSVLVQQDMTAPIEPVADLEQAIRDVLDAPLESPPLRALARPGLRVTIAFDDPTVPCYAPVWHQAINAVVADLTAGGVALSDIELVCGPAVGGIVLAYETARHLGCRAAFTEKEPGGTMALKRGFRLEPGTRVLVVEDVITTGGSVKKTLHHLRQRDANVVGVAVLIDRSGGEAQFDCPFVPLAHLPLDSRSPDECDLCRQGVDLVDPDDIVL